MDTSDYGNEIPSPIFETAATPAHSMKNLDGTNGLLHKKYIMTRYQIPFLQKSVRVKL